MSPSRYILASLRQYRRIHWAVAAGVAVTTAVITGALLVGDSMRGSLRDLALSGLGRVDTVLLAEHPFRTELSGELEQLPAASHVRAVPLIAAQGAATRTDGAGASRRAARLDVWGVTPEFWSLAAIDSRGPQLGRNEIILVDAVADELGVKAGEYVVLRLPLSGATPADSTLGEKEDAAASRRLRVSAVLSDRDAAMARFSLRPTQQSPRNVFVALATLQGLLELSGKANAVALAADGPASAQPMSPEVLSAIKKQLRPELADFGLVVEQVEREPDESRGYVRISADRLVVTPSVVDLAQRLYGDAGLQPVVTYLANAIAAGNRRIPYSTVAGVDSTAALGPVLDDASTPIVLRDDEVALNDWAAKDLDVQLGDEITLTFYEPETTHGILREHAPLRLMLRAIVPLMDDSGLPTLAADPKFAPELPGVTDQESIDAWELPFELVETVRDRDEDYWDQWRTTPKAFVSHSLAARLWRTRWGTDSVLRVPVANGSDNTRGDSADSSSPPSQISVGAIQQALREGLDPADLGMRFIPVKRQSLAAASGTTPFDGLFLGFSLFLMASAVMLTALLFRLGIEQRAREVGLLLAAGVGLSRVRRLLVSEALIVASCGALIGALAGVGYAAIMVHGLNTWWVDAMTTPFLRLHVTPQSMIIGLIAGVVIAGAAIWWSLRRFARLSARQLLAGDCQPGLAVRSASQFARVAIPAACLVAALGLGIAAVRWEGEAQAGAFFGGGALALLGILAFVRATLRSPGLRRPKSLTLAGLAARSARRNPGRTMLSLSLAATASFLIVALSAFRLAPTTRGTGGFDLLATSDVPLHFDLNAPDGRRQFGFSDRDSERLADSTFVGFRVREGDDASCLNLYQTTQPRILGAPKEINNVARFGFAAPRTPPTRAEVDGARLTPWLLLDKDLGSDENGRPIVPMILDRNTAFYSLKLYAAGDKLRIRDAFDREVALQIVGLLANSVLQGDCIISEANFLRLFPDVSGRRFFLVRRGETGPPVGELASLLETQLEDFGVDVVDSRRRLADLLAVQNTYLSTFQSLGALGLLLGALGLAVVQLRSVLERRGELALLQAAGFRRRRLAHMVLAENLVLLLGGLGIGCAAALAAVAPHAAIEQVGAPWRTLATLLAVVAAAGAAAAWVAARAALRAPLIPALRGD